MAERLRVLVAGMVAGDPRQGGASWAVLQYLLGLERLGHEVWLVEPVAELAPASVAYFEELRAAFGLSRAALLAPSRQTAGVSYGELRAAAASADLLLNVSGMLTDEALFEPIPTRVYLDLDPCFNQLWQSASGIDMRFDRHTHFVTVGQALGAPECPVPTLGLDWIPTLPPVVLERWPVATELHHDAFTTVGNWRGYGSIEHGGVLYGQRAHSLRELFELPRLSEVPLRLALAIHPEEERDLAALAEHGWQLVDPAEVAGTPTRYAEFIRSSKGELGVAKAGYVRSRCGWFSDRSACYLASGRPVLAQETGFSRFLPTGEGLLAFATVEQAAAGLAEIGSRYELHRHAARALAEEWLDSDRVLSRLLERVGAGA